MPTPLELATPNILEAVNLIQHIGLVLLGSCNYHPYIAGLAKRVRAEQLAGRGCGALHGA